MDILNFLFNLISLLKLNFFPLFFGISIIEVLFELLKELYIFSERWFLDCLKLRFKLLLFIIIFCNAFLIFFWIIFFILYSIFLIVVLIFIFGHLSFFSNGLFFLLILLFKKKEMNFWTYLLYYYLLKDLYFDLYLDNLNLNIIYYYYFYNYLINWIFCDALDIYSLLIY